jgi:hypothetical protein
MAFVATLGADNANSYITAAEATTLLADIPESEGLSEWLNLIDADKQKTLVAATYSIDPLNWKGTICSSTQSLAWPRQISHDGRYTICTALPYDLKLAASYMAAYMGQLGGYTQIGPGGGSVASSDEDPIPGLSPQALAGYEKVSFGKGALELTLADPSKMQLATTQLPIFAVNLLAKYIKGAGGVTISTKTVRSVAGLRNSFIGIPGLSAAFENALALRDGKIFAAPGHSLLDLP